jgi:hypothetical protein
MDLRKIDVVYLHGTHKPERKEHMEKTLFDLDHECHVGVSDQGKKSGVMGMIEILKKRLSEPFKPFLLLEDDCSRTKWFRYTLPVPDDTDAIYVGLSIYGIHPFVPQGYPNLVSWTQVSNEPELVKLQNMLSTHAIIFISQRWTEMCLECFEKTLAGVPESGNYDYDILLCRKLPIFNAYALRKPLFYQDDTVGGCDAATYIEFTSESS